MDRKALSFVLVVMAAAGCPGPSGLQPLPDGPPPEYEKPRSYDPESGNIDGTPPPLGSESADPPPPPALPVDDEPLPEPTEVEPPTEEPTEEPVPEP